MRKQDVTDLVNLNSTGFFRGLVSGGIRRGERRLRWRLGAFAAICLINAQRYKISEVDRETNFSKLVMVT